MWIIARSWISEDLIRQGAFTASLRPLSISIMFNETSKIGQTWIYNRELIRPLIDDQPSLTVLNPHHLTAPIAPLLSSSSIFSPSRFLLVTPPD
jgi:hypothetical protein